MLNIKKHIWEGFSYGYKEIGSVGNGKVKVSPVDEVTVRTNANCQYTYSDIRKSICRIFSPANTFFDVYGNYYGYVVRQGVVVHCQIFPNFYELILQLNPNYGEPIESSTE